MEILIIDDCLTDLKILAASLARLDHQVIAVDNGKEAWEILQRTNSPKLVIMGLVMPDMDSIKLVEKIRTLPIYTYVIFMTANNDRGTIAESLVLGVDDYLIKGYCIDELYARISVGMRIVRSHTLLTYHAELDPLTKCLNRRAMDNVTTEAQRNRLPFSVAMIDIDHFKKVNDSYGHKLGDDVLQCLVERIKSAIRSTDILSRHGGEEFLLYLPGASEKAAVDICNRIRQKIGEVDFATDMGYIPITVSIGISTWNRIEYIDDLIGRADVALYEAKRVRNVVVPYGSKIEHSESYPFTRRFLHPNRRRLYSIEVSPLW